MDYDFFGDDSPSDNNEYNPFADTTPVYEAEIGAFERTGMGGRVGTALAGGIIGDLQKKMMREMASPEERFAQYVDAISRRLNGEDIVSISNPEIDTMLDKIPSIAAVRYKNPTAYILGFLASRGGRVMDRDKVVDIITNVLPLIGDSGVEGPDVVRYARYWTMYLK
jgi:hypothetical protein